jgi:hypothetical protein
MLPLRAKASLFSGRLKPRRAVEADVLFGRSLSDRRQIFWRRRLQVPRNNLYFCHRAFWLTSLVSLPLACPMLHHATAEIECPMPSQAQRDIDDEIAKVRARLRQLEAEPIEIVEEVP